MGTCATPPGNNGGRLPRLPREERFWDRYSPHHEFPLSSVGSVTFFFLGFVLIYAVVVLSKLIGADHAPLDMSALAVEGGGGGGENGAGGASERPEAVGPQPSQPSPAKLPPVPLFKDLPKPQVKSDQLAEALRPEDPNDPILQEATQSLEKLAKLQKQAQADLLKGLRDQGKGPGDGTGAGAAKGPGAGKALSDRQKRVIRWSMVFDTRSGEDYRVQLLSLGGVLAIPGPDGQYLVIRNLRPPVKPVPQDLQKIQMIWWIDDRPESIRGLAIALGLRDLPQHVIAFFPESLEQKLVQLEKNYARKQEHEIKETRFRVVFNGRTGKYEPVVIDQR